MSIRPARQRHRSTKEQAATKTVNTASTDSRNLWRRWRALRWAAAPFLFMIYKLIETGQWLGRGFAQKVFPALMPIIVGASVLCGILMSFGFLATLVLPNSWLWWLVSVYTAKEEYPCMFCFYPPTISLIPLGLTTVWVLAIALLLGAACRQAFTEWFPANWHKVKTDLDLE